METAEISPSDGEAEQMGPQSVRDGLGRSPDPAHRQQYFGSQNLGSPEPGAREQIILSPAELRALQPSSLPSTQRGTAKFPNEESNRRK